MSSLAPQNGLHMLKDQVALVTRASSNVGRAVAMVLQREGARLVVSDADCKSGQEATHALLGRGADAIFIQADIGIAQQGEALVQKSLSHFGRLDIACNIASICGVIAPTADYPLESWVQVININLSGVFYGMKYQIAAMLKNGGGSIVNIATVAGAVGIANSAAYIAAKHGVVGLTQAAALEYSAHKVRINAIGPRFHHAPMVAGRVFGSSSLAALDAAHPGRPLGTPEEVAELVAWIASGRATFVTGAYYPVDVGDLAQ